MTLSEEERLTLWEWRAHRPEVAARPVPDGASRVDDFSYERDGQCYSKFTQRELQATISYLEWHPNLHRFLLEERALREEHQALDKEFGDRIALAETWGDLPECGIYFLFSRHGECLYVGESMQMHQRMRQHTSEVRGRYARDEIDIWVLPCAPEERRALEERFIRAMFPRDNVILNTGR